MKRRSMEYEYVSVDAKGAGVNQWKYEGYKGAIEDMAEQGYRFCGCVPTLFNGFGVPVRMELVFEREERR